MLDSKSLDVRETLVSEELVDIDPIDLSEKRGLLSAEAEGPRRCDCGYILLLLLFCTGLELSSSSMDGREDMRAMCPDLGTAMLDTFAMLMPFDIFNETLWLLRGSKV
jgi:hypothetical protein